MLVISMDNKDRLENKNIVTVIIDVQEDNYITSVQAGQKAREEVETAAGGC